MIEVPLSASRSRGERYSLRVSGSGALFTQYQEFHRLFVWLSSLVQRYGAEAYASPNDHMSLAYTFLSPR